MDGHQRRVECEGGVSTGVMGQVDGHQRRVECEGGVSTRVTDTHTRGGLNLKAESAPETVTEEKAETGIKTEREKPTKEETETEEMTARDRN